MGLFGNTLLINPKEIQVPICAYIEYADLASDYINIKIFKNFKIHIEDKPTQLDGFNEALLNTITSKHKIDNYNFYRPKIKLIIDENISYAKLAPIFLALRKNQIHWVFFVAELKNSNLPYHTGFHFLLNPTPPLDPPIPIWEKVELILKNENSTARQAPPPPPLLPPFHYSLMELKNGFLSDTIIPISHIHKDGCVINTKQVSNQQLRQSILHQMQDISTSYQLNILPNTKYKTWLGILATIRQVTKELRDSSTKIHHRKTFSALVDLNKKNRNRKLKLELQKIGRKYPGIVIFE